MQDDWSVYNPPPEGHEDVAEFAWGLYEQAKAERDRLAMELRWSAAYKLFRGDHDWRANTTTANKPWLNINLYFANVQRTVANLTSRNPVAEVVDLDGGEDNAAAVLTSRTRKWWKDNALSELLNDAGQVQEVYGTGIEKVVWSSAKKQPVVLGVDPYGFFPAPGAETLDDCRYVCHCTSQSVAAIESKFRVKGVEGDAEYSVLKGDREESRPFPSPSDKASARYSGVKLAEGGSKGSATSEDDRALVVELWIKDERVKKTDVEVEGVNPETGEPIMVTQTTTEPVYPGGIRVITVTNSGRVILADVKNPNINPEMPVEMASQSYLWDKFPFWMTRSYRDTSCIWGMSIAEQVGDLNRRIEALFSKINDYLMRSLCPTLILPQGCGVSRSMINTRPNLVIVPTNLQASQFIRYLPMPGLSSEFYSGINMLLTFFDRVYQIEDADRGQRPAGVIAASAIIALQERNAALIQHKIRSIDALVEFRGKCAVSLFQNFGIFPESLEVDGTPLEGGFAGINYAGRRFNYVVESGSTTPRTSLQVQEQAVALHRAGAIDNQALLEVLNFPNWRKVIERTGETQLDAALNILIQAGMPKEVALQLRQGLMQPQGGPGDGRQNPPVQSTPPARTPQPAKAA